MHANTISALILDTAIKATLVCLLASVPVFVLRNRSAASRHLVRTFTLAALLLLPFSAQLLPAWHVQGLPQFAPEAILQVPDTAAGANPAPRVSVATAADSTPQNGVNPRHGFATTAPRVQTAMPRPSRSIAQRAAAGSTVPRAEATMLPQARQPQREPSSASVDTSKPIVLGPRLLLLTWLAGAFCFATRWMCSAFRLSRIVERASLLRAANRYSQLESLAAALGIRRKIVLLESTDTDVPLTTGVIRPAVILPPEHHEWSAMRTTAIFNHELAHIKRLDAFTQLLADLATVLYWWHPLVWISIRAMRAERERACDDYVLAAGTKASDYAHELLDIVSTLHLPELKSALAMARRSQLGGRVMAVLNPALPRGSVSRKAALAVAVLTLAIVLPLAAMRPAPQQAGTPGAQTSQARKSKPSPTSTQTPEAAASSSTGEQVTGTVVSDEVPDPSRMAELRAKIAALQQQMQGKQGAEFNRLSDQLAQLRDSLADLEDRRAMLTEPDVPETPEAPEPPEAPEAPEAPEPPETPTAYAPQSAPAAPAAPSAPAAPPAPSAPAAPATPSGPGAMDLGPCGRVHMHNSWTNDDGERRSWKASWSGDNCDVSLHAEGEIRFNADANAIESISSGGYFEVNERLGDTLRQVKVTPGTAGLQYVYKLNGKEQPFEGEARNWFSGFLLALERTTGFAADARVAKLMAKGGPTAVLDEINNLQSDYVRSIYFRKLLEQPNLPTSIVLRIINQSSQQISGDYELARVLTQVSKEYELPDETSRTAFLNATGKLKSDYEHSRVLIELLKRPNISPENVRMGLSSAGGIKSDYEKSRIALALVEQKSFAPGDVANYLKLVATIHSDYEKSRDLLAPMQRYQLAPESVNQIMDAAAVMSSDYEKSRLLTALADKGKFDEAQMSNYLKVVASMKSDYERSRSLMALMQHNNTLSPASVSRAIDATTKMTSDYEKSRVLLSLLQTNKFDEAQMNTFLLVVDSMKSDYERSRSLTAIMEKNKLSDAAIGKVFEAVTRISSDYEKARVLTAVAHGYHLEGPLRDSYIKAAESIRSEYDRDRALAAVVKRASL